MFLLRTNTCVGSERAKTETHFIGRHRYRYAFPVGLVPVHIPNGSVPVPVRTMHMR
jgi:hypothetical protein